MVAEDVAPITKPSWLAIVYNNNRESKRNEYLESSPLINRPPVARLLQVPFQSVAQLSGSKKTSPAGTAFYEEPKTIVLRPGTNIGISSSDWQAVMGAASPTLIGLLEKGAIEVVAPTLFLESPQSPGFRCFEVEQAKRLISSTLHEEWLEEWLVGESRPDILKAASDQKVKILAAKQRASQ